MKKIIAAALSLLVFTALFSSCGSEERSVRTVEINENGELIVIFSDGSKSNVGVVKGEKGDTGEKGADGSDGIDGVDGVDGLDGKDGAKGDKGAVGADGHRGRSIEKVTSDNEGNLVIAYSDGKTETVELLGAIYMFGGYLNEEKTAEWALYNGGFLHIYGKGSTYDYQEGNSPWSIFSSMISAVFVDTSEGLVLDAELLSGIDEDRIHYVESTTPMWVDMAVSAPLFATSDEALQPDGATPVTHLPLGTEMAVAELCDGYARILYGGESLYIPRKYVRADNGSVVYSNEEMKLEVTGDNGAVLRYFPDTASDNKYKSISKGSVLTCTGVSMNRNWYRVLFEGEVLYVYTSVVAPV